MYVHNSATVVTNSTFWQNVAGDHAGGGIHISGCSPKLINNTLYGNTATNGGQLYSFGTSVKPQVINCILRAGATGIENDGGATTSVLYSCLAGGYTGQGNLDADPLFVDAANGDLSLSEGSPCIDRGISEDAPATDILGTSRPQGLGVDMGAYEYFECDYQWREITGASALPMGENPMVYDAVRGVCLTYAGVVRNTLIWNGAIWQVVSTEGPVPDRYGYGMAYDSDRERVVLFGGCEPGGTVRYGDTWEWDGASWTQVSTTGPTPRSGQAMIYDSARGQTILYGGSNASSQPQYDTWSWNGSEWQQVASSGPGGRWYNHQIAYDANRERVVLFGGYSPGSGPYLDDTWEWDGASWTSIPVTSPPARADHRMVYDSHRGTIILFGGGSEAQLLNDTWEYDGIVWQQLNVGLPGQRWRHLMCYDSARNVVVMTGGGGTDGSYSDTWELGCGAPEGPDYTYTYDALDRLGRIDPGNGIQVAYEYDPAGNRLQKRVYSQLLLSLGEGSPLSGGIENTGTDVTILQIALQVSEDEGILLNSLALTASGAGNEAADISEAKLWLDVNADGQADGSDVQLGSTLSGLTDNGMLTFNFLGQTMPASQIQHVLLTYTFNGSASQGETFQASLVNADDVVAYGGGFAKLRDRIRRTRFGEPADCIHGHNASYLRGT